MTDPWPDLSGFWSYVLFVTDVVLAIGVTIHILLRKREVASAVGWIGLAWFAPIIGALAYVILGINRVQRRARRLRPPQRARGTRPRRPDPGEDDHLAPLARGIARITRRAVMPGNAIEILHHGDQAYPAMLDAIAHAQQSVGLSSYIFDHDAWGARFVDALAEAHIRGVQVRVLIDGVGGGWLISPAYHALRRRNVPAVRFLHEVLPWRMPFLNLRSHKKILVVDGSIGFTGGVNIAAQNVLAEKPRDPVQDTHFRVAGPAVRELVQSFAQDWAFATDEELDPTRWLPDIPEQGSAPARIIDSGPDEDVEKIEFAMLQAVACARDRIAVMTPYFLPDDRLLTALSMAAMRGVAVDITIPQVSDHKVVDWATRANIGPLLRDGVRIWRSPPPFRHSKIMLVDTEWVLVGSANWDSRSLRLNFELCMEVYDEPLALTLAGLIETNQQNRLTQSELDARSMPIRLRDAAARLALPYL